MLYQLISDREVVGTTFIKAFTLFAFLLSSGGAIFESKGSNDIDNFSTRPVQRAQYSIGKK